MKSVIVYMLKAIVNIRLFYCGKGHSGYRILNQAESLIANM